MKIILALVAVLFAGSILFFVQRNDEPDGVSAEAEAEAAERMELELQLEIEREMLAIEREMLELERAEMEEAREAALVEAEEETERGRLAEAEVAAQTSAPVGGAEVSPDLRATPVTGQTAPGYGGESYEAQDYSIFYEELHPHGSWFETSHYGYVWQPEVARRSSDWRPYTEGHWVDTEEGWAWWSEEPFGWATYHYGRWAYSDNTGWIWVPGPDWAPAWVSWRESPEYIGWAPLPPVTLYETNLDYGNRTDSVCGIPSQHYNFVPIQHFAGPVNQHFLPPAQNVKIVQQTTNITHIHVHQQTIIVRGPRPEPLRERFGPQGLQRHTLNRSRWSQNRRTDPSPRQQGSILDFLAPQFAPLAATRTRPANLEGRLEQFLPADPAARPNQEILQRFTRQRAREQVQASRLPGTDSRRQTAATPATAGSSANDQTIATMARSVEEIRRTIADREARIAELSRERESISPPAPAPEEVRVEPETAEAPRTEEGALLQPGEEVAPIAGTRREELRRRREELRASADTKAEERSPRSERERATPPLERELASSETPLAGADPAPVGDPTPSTDETAVAPAAPEQVPLEVGEVGKADVDTVEMPTGETGGSVAEAAKEGAVSPAPQEPSLAPVAAQESAENGVAAGGTSGGSVQPTTAGETGASMEAGREAALNARRVAEEAKAEAEAKVRGNQEAAAAAMKRAQEARAEAEAQRKAGQKAAAAAAMKTAQEARAEAEAQMKAGQEAAEAAKRAAEEARAKAEAEAQMKAGQEAAEAAKNAAEEARAKAEAKAQMKAGQEAAEEAKRRAEQEARERAEAERRREEQEAAAAAMRAAEEAKRRAEQEAAAAAMRAAEEAKRRAEQEARERAEAERRRQEEGVGS